MAIRLAESKFNIVLIERDKFPRQKLCGEFVSPECVDYLKSLNLINSIKEIGGDKIFETRFFSERGKSISVPSDWFSGGKSGALGISRAEMDFRLLEKAKKLGIKVLEETKCVSVLLDKDRISSVLVKNQDYTESNLVADLFIDATGRARTLGKLLHKQMGIQKKPQKIKHIAFKTHFENVNLEKGVCEIYFFNGGYGGLSYIENGTANHCFLIDSKIARKYKGNADKILKEVIFKNSRAYNALKDARKQFNWLGVSVEKFGIQLENPVKNLISVGDAAAFIDPFTGSGMLMALESSKLLANTILSEADILTEERIASIKFEFERIHKLATKKRLRVCSIAHRFSFSPKFVGFIIFLAGLNSSVLKGFSSLTRPSSKSDL